MAKKLVEKDLPLNAFWLSKANYEELKALLPEIKTLEEKNKKQKEENNKTIKHLQGQISFLVKEIEKKESELPELLNNYARNCIDTECSLCGSSIEKAKQFLKEKK